VGRHDTLGSDHGAAKDGRNETPEVKYMDMIPRDTTNEAWTERVRGLRRLGVAGRAAMTFELSDNLRHVVVDGIRHRHPTWDETRVKHETFRLVYGDRLYREIFGGDRASNG